MPAVGEGTLAIDTGTTVFRSTFQLFVSQKEHPAAHGKGKGRLKVSFDFIKTLCVCRWAMSGLQSPIFIMRKLDAVPGLTISNKWTPGEHRGLLKVGSGLVPEITLKGQPCVWHVWRGWGEDEKSHQE